MARPVETIFPQYTKSIAGYWLFNARATIENFDDRALKATIALWGRHLTKNRSSSFGFNQVGIASGTVIGPRRLDGPTSQGMANARLHDG